MSVLTSATSATSATSTTSATSATLATSAISANGVAGYAGALANPMLQFALQASRQGLRDELGALGKGSAWGPDYGSERFEAVTDDPANLARWRPDVRLAVLGWVAAEGLSATGRSGVAELRLNGKMLVRLRRPNWQTFARHAGRVADLAKLSSPRLRDRVYETRHNEILTQITPFFAYWSALLPLHPDRTPRTFDLMQLGLSLASGCALRLKHALACPRPNELDSRVHPIILTPAHGSLPSGHATEASLVSLLLSHLISADSRLESGTHGAALRKLAHRIAENRVYAGVHYPIDGVAGHLLGETLGEMLTARCRGDMLAQPRTFQGDKATGADVDAETAQLGDDATHLPLCANSGKPLDLTEPDPQLAWLWQQARREWGYAAA